MAAKTITTAALAANFTAHRVLIDTNREGELFPARRKTGVAVARVLAVRARLVSAGRRATRVYDINTTAGQLTDIAAVHTFWLAPEDTAAVERARSEALELDAAHTPAPAAEITEEQPAEVAPAPATPAADDLDSLTFAELMVLAKAHKVPGRGVARIAALREGVRAALALAA